MPPETSQTWILIETGSELQMAAKAAEGGQNCACGISCLIPGSLFNLMSKQLWGEWMHGIVNKCSQVELDIFKLVY